MNWHEYFMGFARDAATKSKDTTKELYERLGLVG